MVLINFSNQLSAGPKNISLNFIKEILKEDSVNEYIFILPSIDEFLDFKDTKNVTFRFVEVGNGLFGKIIKTFRINWRVIPEICKNNKINTILAFGNFLTYSLPSIKKIVLLHHPPIVDDNLYKSLPITSRFAELIKRFIFWLTIKNVDIVVVQSSFMHDELFNKYPDYKNKFKIISNPISSHFKKDILTLANNDKMSGFQGKSIFTLLYVSRFYPHKNHEFLIKLAKKFATSEFNIEILVTINPSLDGADKFLDAVKLQKLPIYNLSELNQSELSQNYMKSDFMIFPSNAETFGNPIIESLSFSLPIILPNKGYARTLVGENGAYYDAKDVNSCFHLISDFLLNEEKYVEYAGYCYSRSMTFPDPTTWVNQYLDLFNKDEI
jgi:glycosyltransferase involved in cell wall biosynthesis